MAVYKDNATGTWRVIYRFTNWKGERKQTQKRGFATKREAQAWEHEAMLKQGAKLDMTFGSFFEVYEADKKQRVKESTWESKSHVIRTKILPYFENRKIAEIEAKDVIAWLVTGLFSNSSASHLLVFCFSANTAFSRFKVSILKIKVRRKDNKIQGHSKRSKGERGF